MNVTRKWSLMAVLLVVAVLAAGWFLLISPKRGEAADLRTKAEAQDSANSSLEAQLSELKAQEAGLPKLQARLAVIHRQIPDNPALPALIRSLSAAGNQVGVSLDAISPALPAPLVVAAPAPVAAPATTDTTSTSTTSSTDPAAAPAPAPVAPAPSLYQVPLTVNVTGSYFEMEQFVNKLEGLKRSFLVTGFTVTPASSDAASRGDVSVVLQGRVFVAPPAPAAATPTTPVASATAGQ